MYTSGWRETKKKTYKKGNIHTLDCLHKMNCFHCEKQPKFYCAGCFKAQYCSKTCALINWEQHHKNECLYIGVKIRRYDNDDVYNHFMKFTDQDEYLDNQIDAIFRYPIWIRKAVPISDIDWAPKDVDSKESQKLINYYKTLETKQPEVILVPESSTKPYRIVDGYHRIAVAVFQKKKSIVAFLPLDSDKRLKE